MTCLQFCVCLSPDGPAAIACLRMLGYAGVASFGALTALRNLKFDLGRHRSMSDDQLRQLAGLRLTSLSLPGLCDVRLGCCPMKHRCHSVLKHAARVRLPPLLGRLVQAIRQALWLCRRQGKQEHSTGRAERFIVQLFIAGRWGRFR